MWVSIDLGGTNLQVGLFSGELELLYAISRPLEGREYEYVLEEMERGVEQMRVFIQKEGLSGSIVGGGIGAPGWCDHGVLRSAANFSSWRDCAICVDLEARVNMPVFNL